MHNALAHFERASCRFPSVLLGAKHSQFKSQQSKDARLFFARMLIFDQSVRNLLHTRQPTLHKVEDHHNKEFLV